MFSDESRAVSNHLEAVADFRRARRQAALQTVLARLTGQSNELLSYEAVVRKLKITGRAERGRQMIPVAAIVGSVGRYADFTRSFLPRQDSDEKRWAGVKVANAEMAGLPPIEVYQVGEAYFVLDGHHRVSIARQEGSPQIEAYVTRIRTKVLLTPETQPDELIVKFEQADFLSHTQLDRLRPGADLSVTVAGQYALLEEHIQVHQYYMGLELKREVEYPEAAAHWYDTVYLPMIAAVRERGLLREFADRTETDFYLWVAEHRAALEEELGWCISPEAAAADLAARRTRQKEKILGVALPTELTTGPAPGQWRQSKLTDRYGDRLFLDILVPLSAEATPWPVLEQAFIIARREVAQLHGLCVVPTEADKDTEATRALQAEFQRRCEAAGLTGHLAIEAGDIAPKICERALLTDLVVLNVAHPPATAPLAKLASGWRTIIWQCARPVLATPGLSTPLGHALLAYDGSPKANEALFLATYLAERWKSKLSVVTIVDAANPASVQDQAREYLELHEVKANYLTASGLIAETVQKVAEEQQCDLVIMGGYGANPIKEALMGSSVDWMLRGECWPLFICR